MRTKHDRTWATVGAGPTTRNGESPLGAALAIVGEERPAAILHAPTRRQKHVAEGDAAASPVWSKGQAGSALPVMASPLRRWPEGERPRERLIQQGAEALSNAELLAILLRTGSRGQSAVGLAMQLLTDHGESLARLLSLSATQLMRRHGLGPARATTLAAVIELARRASHEQLQENAVLDNPEAVRDYLALTLRGQVREVFMVLFVNTRHRLIQADALFTGTLNQTTVYPREVLRRAIELDAAAVILAHNHPSGHPAPSAADRTLTRTLQTVLSQVDIQVLDHIIVAGGRQFSFAREGLL